MKRENQMELKFDARSSLESFARVCAGAFASQLNPTLEQVADIKTAVSEAVTNAIVHGYQNKGGEIILRATAKTDEIVIEIQDFGCGIPDVEKAREPFFTTAAGEERSGMGFTVMETFMDRVDVQSDTSGTIVTMLKHIPQDE